MELLQDDLSTNLEPESPTEHEQAIAFITEKLIEEFKDTGKLQEWFRIPGCIPDITVCKNTQKHLVVEVGSTKAEKIEKYLNDSQIDEIRWYTKRGTLIGVWQKDRVYENLPLYTPKQLRNAFRGQLANIRTEYEWYRKAITQLKEKFYCLGHRIEQILIHCPYCGENRRIMNSDLTDWGPYYLMWQCGCKEATCFNYTQGKRYDATTA